MGVYIKGMEMPTIEMEWTIRYGADGKWYAIDTNAETTDGEWHEIVPAPPHGDLIDRDALMKGEGRYIISFGKEGIDVAEINRAPTIIQADTFLENGTHIIDTKGKSNYDPKHRFVISSPTIIPAEPPKEET